jgi:N-acetylglucosaminyldiphosphoundecaprenol N-acetyl-beta-D-mannosaminyltransferase
MKNTIGNFDIEAIPCVTLFLNHYSFLRLTEEKFFDNALMGDLAVRQEVKIHIDGGLFVRHLRLFGVNVNRYSFDWSSIAAPLFSHLSTIGETISFIGGTNAEAKHFRQIIAEKFPSLRIDCYNGYEEARPALLKLSQASERGYVVLGMGSPLQEKLALDLSSANSAIRVMTCGGFITQTAQFGDIYGGAWRLLPRFVVRAIRQRHVVGRIIKDYPKAMVKATVCGMLGQNIFGTKT